MEQNRPIFKAPSRIVACVTRLIRAMKGHSLDVYVQSRDLAENVVWGGRVPFVQDLEEKRVLNFEKRTAITTLSELASYSVWKFLSWRKKQRMEAQASEQKTEVTA